MEYLSDSENEYPDDIEEDIILNEHFPPPCEYTKKHLLEYRINLLTRIKTILEPGSLTIVETNCVLKNKIRYYHLFKTKNEEIPLLTLDGSPFLSERFTGRIMLSIRNIGSKRLIFGPGSHIGNLILTTFS